MRSETAEKNNYGLSSLGCDLSKHSYDYTFHDPKGHTRESFRKYLKRCQIRIFIINFYYRYYSRGTQLWCFLVSGLSFFY